MDKQAKSPLPPKTGQPKEEPQREKQSADPTFIRGTIDPPTKKGGSQ